jgi:DNA-directed RNA polymerase specialized sigma24 family protein
MPGHGGEVTLLLVQLREGNQDAAGQLVPLVYTELRGVAGARKTDIDQELLIAADTLENTVAIDEVLERLAQIDLRQSRLIELRFFGGLNVEEEAEVMGVSEITIKREWRLAKAWLHRELATRKSG